MYSHRTKCESWHCTYSPHRTERCVFWHKPAQRGAIFGNSAEFPAVVRKMAEFPRANRNQPGCIAFIPFRFRCRVWKHGKREQSNTGNQSDYRRVGQNGNQWSVTCDITGKRNLTNIKKRQAKTAFQSKYRRSAPLNRANK